MKIKGIGKECVLGWKRGVQLWVLGFITGVLAVFTIHLLVTW